MNVTATLLNGSIQIETMKKHLCKMLDEFEAQFETGTEFSYEAKADYIAAAKFMQKFGRKLDITATIESTL